jgi:MFS family permease
MNDLPLPSEVLGAMITPAVLISAAGTLVLSTSNRLTRVVDRVRVLAGEAEHLPAGGRETPKGALIADQIPRLARRVLLLRNALTVLYAAIGLLVAASIGVGLSAVLPWHSGWIAIVCGILGACALFGASVLLVREAGLAVSSTLQEMEHLRRIVAGAGVPGATIP